MLHKLTDAAIRKAPATDKPRKMFDGGGLFLLVNPNGSKWWRFRYRYGGKEKLLSLGVYPDTGLKKARDKAKTAREILDGGSDPSVVRQVARGAEGGTFEAVAREYFKMRASDLAPQTIKRDMDRLEKYIFPRLGSRPISELTAPEFLAVLRRVEATDKLDTLHRAKDACGRIMRFAIATGRADRDPVADLKGAFSTRAATNHAAITDPRRVGELLRAIDGYTGQPVTVAAMQLAPLLFVRPSELRKARWSEFDLDGDEPTWRIPAERMKMRDAHLVPLSRQAVAILRDLAILTGPEGFLFPSTRTPERPISENTINAALRRLDYSKDEQTGHGFRTVASTLLNEQGFDPDCIELQLAHKPRDKVRAAYNRAQRLPERRAMMQAWADYLDGLKAGGKVVGIRKGKAK